MPTTIELNPVQPKDIKPDGLIQEWREKSFDRFLTTKIWRKFFEFRGLDMEIPFLDWSEEEVKKPLKTMRGWVPGLMVPNFFEGTDREVITQLNTAFPVMRISTGIGAQFSREKGWVKVEFTEAAQNRGTDQEQVERFMQENGLQGQRLSTYALASAFNEFVTDRCFDTTTTCRLPGTFDSSGRMMGTRTGNDGSVLLVTVNSPRLASYAQGARFENLRVT